MRPLVGVRRDRGQRYLLVTIVAFAVTVAAVRVYLDSAGYPKVGGGGLHVAHMLWGGLLLVVAAVLLQLFVGRRALYLSALAAGVGVGLFIDEVGKFITESNDYFFAPAAPIIYGAILLLLVVWLAVRRDDRPAPAQAAQGAIEALRDAADGRLTEPDRRRAISRLEASQAPATIAMSTGLLALLNSPEVGEALAEPGWLARGEGRRWLRRLLPDVVERVIVWIGLALSALNALVGLLIAYVVLSGAVTFIPDPDGPIEIPQDPFWAMLLGLVWVLVGAANIVALILDIAGRRQRGMAIAQYSVLAGLVAGGLLGVFVSQLQALTGVLLQLLLLLLIVDQRRRLEDRSG